MIFNNEKIKKMISIISNIDRLNDLSCQFTDSDDEDLEDIIRQLTGKNHVYGTIKVLIVNKAMGLCTPNFCLLTYSVKFRIELPLLTPC